MNGSSKAYMTVPFLIAARWSESVWFAGLSAFSLPNALPSLPDLLRLVMSADKQTDFRIQFNQPSRRDSLHRPRIARQLPDNRDSLESLDHVGTDTLYHV